MLSIKPDEGFLQSIILFCSVLFSLFVSSSPALLGTPPWPCPLWLGFVLQFHLLLSPPCQNSTCRGPPGCPLPWSSCLALVVQMAGHHSWDCPGWSLCSHTRHTLHPMSLGQKVRGTLTSCLRHSC